MSIYDDQHMRFRNAVVDTMCYIASMSKIYATKEQKDQYVDDAIDTAFTTILHCFDDDVYQSLTDTVCRRCAKSEIFDSIECDDIDNIDGESVFEDIENMMEDEEDA